MWSVAVFDPALPGPSSPARRLQLRAQSGTDAQHDPRRHTFQTAGGPGRPWAPHHMALFRTAGAQTGHII
jgi:hypothetical protein